MRSSCSSAARCARSAGTTSCWPGRTASTPASTRCRCSTPERGATAAAAAPTAARRCIAGRTSSRAGRSHATRVHEPSMITSMTGFASATHEAESATTSVTVKTVNHRFLDVQLRVPSTLAAAENALRTPDPAAPGARPRRGDGRGAVAPGDHADRRARRGVRRARSAPAIERARELGVVNGTLHAGRPAALSAGAGRARGAGRVARGRSGAAPARRRDGAGRGPRGAGRDAPAGRRAAARRPRRAARHAGRRHRARRRRRRRRARRCCGRGCTSGSAISAAA